jgi:protease PrsW
MSLINYISFAISPALIIVAIIYLRFKFSIKSYANIRNAIILGMISVIFVFFANYIIDLWWGGKYNNMRRMAFFVFIVIAFSSELGKFLPLKFSFFKLKTFSGPLEGLIYSVFIGLGFSTIATILFAFGQLGSMEQINHSTLFLFTYPLANIIFAISMGFFVGLSKTRKNAFIDASTGLFVATFFHGLFYFGFVTADIRLLIFDAIGFIIIGTTFVVKSVSIKLDDRK